MRTPSTAARRLLFGLGLGVWLSGGGCEAPTGEVIGNLPPETVLAISDSPTDTTFYVIDLSWWGSDADGEVDHYRFRLDSLWTPTADDTLVAGTTDWVMTRRTRRTFLIPVEGEARSAVFTVLAVDDDGAPDPTPASHTFHVKNRRPTVAFGDGLARPSRSLPAVTFHLTARDADGDDTVTGYRIWFDGQDASAASFFPGTADERITLGPDRFPGAGLRTAFIQSRDETGTWSADTARHEWEVIDVDGKRALLIDQYPNAFTGGDVVDAFYADALAEHLGASGAVVLNLERDGDFRTEEEVALAFAPFEAVLWYSGLQVNNLTDTLARIASLRRASAALEAHAADGGAVFLQSTFAFGDGLPVSEGSAGAAWDSVGTHRVLGFTGLHTNPQSNTNFTLFPFHSLETSPELGGVELRPQGVLNYVDLSGVPTGATPLVWLPPGSIQIGFDEVGNPVENPSPYYGGLDLPYPNGGRMVYLSVPIARADGAGGARQAFDGILELLLP
jgi:hypothetical protein